MLSLTRIEKFSIIMMFFFGVASVVIDLSSVRKAQNYSINFVSGSNPLVVIEFDKIFREHCRKKNISMTTHFTKVEGFDCEFTAAQEARFDELPNALLARSESYLNHKTGFLFLLTGVWAALTGVMLSFKILKVKDE
jgi:hypothetical protein